MRQLIVATQVLMVALITLSISGEIKGQRPTEYDYFVQDLTPAFQQKASFAIDSLKANKNRKKAAEEELKNLLKPYRFYPATVTTLQEDILAMQLDGDKLAAATATLDRLLLAQKRVEEWGRVARVSRNLTAKSFVRGLFERHKSAWESHKKDAEWAKMLIDREVIRYTLLFHRRKDNFSSFKVMPAKLSRTDVGFGNPIPKRDAELFRWENKAKVSDVVSTGSTGAAGSISAEDILGSYPQNGQFAFYPREYRDNSGYILLSRWQQELRGIAEAGHLWMKWKNAKGEVIYSDVTMSSSTLLQYGLPLAFLEENQVYELSMVQIDPLAFDQEVAFFAKKSIDDLISESVYLRERKEDKRAEKLFFRAYFRTSIYSSFLTKVMYTARLEANEGPNVFTLSAPEGFSKEELEGIDGLPALAPFRLSAEVKSEGEIRQFFGQQTQVFLNHPNAEYLTYLKENKDKLNIDSLVAIEFLPYGERYKKYRHLRYTDQDGKKRNAFPKSVKLPALSKEKFITDYGGIPGRITEAEFRDKSPVGPSPGKLTFRYVFHENANESIAALNELVAARRPEYIALLKELKDLSPRVYAGSDFSALLDQISPSVIQKLTGFTAPGLSPKQSFSIRTWYSLPGRTMNSSSHEIKLTE